MFRYVPQAHITHKVRIIWLCHTSRSAKRNTSFKKAPFDTQKTLFCGGEGWIREVAQSAACARRSVSIERWFANTSCLSPAKNFIFAGAIHPAHHNKKDAYASSLLVERDGFEPSKSLTTDLQSAPFGHSGTSPYGAGDRNRTNNLLITNQLLCLLSYTSGYWCRGAGSNHRHRDFQSLALPTELPRQIYTLLLS